MESKLRIMMELLQAGSSGGGDITQADIDNSITLHSQVINGVHGLLISPGKTFTLQNSLIFNGTDGTSHTFPSTNSVLARTDTGQNFVGNNTFGTDLLAIDDTNNLLGIGTSTPQRLVHISNNTSGSATILAIENINTTNNNASIISFRTTTTGLNAASFVEMGAISLTYVEHDNNTRSSYLTFYTYGTGGIAKNAKLRSDGIFEIDSLNLLVNGTEAAPSLRFDAHNNGFYSGSNNGMNVSINGVKSMGIVRAGSFTGLQFNLPTNAIYAMLYQSRGDSYFSICGDSGQTAGANLNIYGGTHATKANYFEIRNGSTVIAYSDGVNFKVNSTTTSTSTTTGAWTVSGGVGISGSLFAQSLNSSNNSSNCYVNIDSGNSNESATILKHLGIARWKVGSDTNKQFFIESRDVAGIYIDQPISIANASGGTISSGGNTQRLWQHSGPSTINYPVTNAVSTSASKVYSKQNVIVSGNYWTITQSLGDGASGVCEIASGIINSGYVMLQSISAMRSSSTDAGSLNELYGQRLDFGHDSDQNAASSTDTAYGIRYRPFLGLGNITNLTTTHYSTPLYNTGTCTANISIYIENQKTAATANSYAIRIANQSAGGYAIKTGLGIHEFGDSVSVLGSLKAGKGSMPVKIMDNAGTTYGNDVFIPFDSGSSIQKSIRMRTSYGGGNPYFSIGHSTNGNAIYEDPSVLTYVDDIVIDTVAGTKKMIGTPLTDGPTLGAELLTSANWITTGWTGDFVNGFTHAAGNTSVLSNTLSATIGSKYLFSITITGYISGSLTFSFGGQSISNWNSSSAFGIDATSIASLTITPTNDFIGTIKVSTKLIISSYPLLSLQTSTSVNNYHVRTSANGRSFYIGRNSGSYDTAGVNNTSCGYEALLSTIRGDNNTAFGSESSKYIVNGYENSSFGAASLYSNINGKRNSSFGCYSLFSCYSGDGNSTFGNRCGYDISTGYNNTLYGYNTGRGITTGYGNSILGSNVIGLAPGLTNNIILATGDGVIKLQYNGTGTWNVVDSTASTSTTTGAWVVAGGSGIGGNLYVGGLANIGGALTIKGISTTDTFSGTTTAITQVSLFIIPIATYRSVEFKIQAVDVVGGKYLTTTIKAIHNGTVPQFSESGQVLMGTSPGTFTCDINGGNLRLLVTPTSANSTSFKVVASMMVI